MRTQFLLAVVVGMLAGAASAPARADAVDRAQPAGFDELAQRLATPVTVNVQVVEVHELAKTPMTLPGLGELTSGWLIVGRFSAGADTEAWRVRAYLPEALADDGNSPAVGSPVLLTVRLSAVQLRPAPAELVGEVVAAPGETREEEDADGDRKAPAVAVVLKRINDLINVNAEGVAEADLKNRVRDAGLIPTLASARLRLEAVSQREEGGLLLVGHIAGPRQLLSYYKTEAEEAELVTLLETAREMKDRHKQELERARQSNSPFALRSTEDRHAAESKRLEARQRQAALTIDRQARARKEECERITAEFVVPAALADRLDRTALAQAGGVQLTVRLASFEMRRPEPDSNLPRLVSAVAGEVVEVQERYHQP